MSTEGGDIELAVEQQPSQIINSGDANFWEELQSLDNYAIKLKSPKGEVESVPLLLVPNNVTQGLNSPLDYTVPVVIVNAGEHVWRKKELVKLCEEFYEKISRTLVVLFQLKQNMNLNNSISIPECFKEELITNLEENKRLNNKLKEQKRKIDRMLRFTPGSWIVLRIASAIFSVVALFVSVGISYANEGQGVAQAIAMTLASGLLGSFSMLADKFMSSREGLVQRRRDTIIPMIVETEHVGNVLTWIQRKLASGDINFGSIQDFIVEVDKCTNKITNARFKILQTHIAKQPNYYNIGFPQRNQEPEEYRIDSGPMPTP